jgi:hypothetical protein
LRPPRGLIADDEDRFAATEFDAQGPVGAVHIPNGGERYCKTHPALGSAAIAAEQQLIGLE